MNPIAITLLAQTDDGSPTYVVACVLVVGVVLLAYLAILAVRVRNQSARLEELEVRLGRVPETTTTDEVPEASAR